MHTSDAGIYCVHTAKNIKSGENVRTEQLEYVILVNQAREQILVTREQILVRISSLAWLIFSLVTVLCG